MNKDYLSAEARKGEAIKKLKKLQDSIDTEWSHIKADKILCNLLTELGLSDVVQEWEKVQKWYA